MSRLAQVLRWRHLGLRFAVAAEVGPQSYYDFGVLSMKYEAEIDGDRAIIDLEERDGHIVASVNERRYEIDVLRPEAGVFLVLEGNAVYEARVSSGSTRAHGDAGLFSVELKGRVFSARLIDRKHRQLTDENTETGQQYLTAPMPGKVVRVLAKQGEAVAAGQGLLVVEAMKMQNEVKSKRAGVVAQLRVKEGDAVTANQVLAVVE
jgi:biotin carboxyl carrier protein